MILRLIIAILLTQFETVTAAPMPTRAEPSIAEKELPPKPVDLWQPFEATAYTANCRGCIGITKTGYDVRNTIYSPKGLRVIAVDPAVIPLGSTVEIRLADGKTFKAKALDIGSAIKGRRIDILVDSYRNAMDFGRQEVELRIIKEAE